MIGSSAVNGYGVMIHIVSKPFSYNLLMSSIEPNLKCKSIVNPNNIADIMLLGLASCMIQCPMEVILRVLSVFFLGIFRIGAITVMREQSPDDFLYHPGSRC